MRVEETELIAAGVERAIRRVIPPAELGLILDNIGINRNAINLATGGVATLNAADADLVVQLAPTRRTSTFEYVRRLRATLPTEFPGVTFFFLPADIVNQVLNLGLPAPIDVQVVGQDKKADYDVASAWPPSCAASPALWTSGCSRWSTCPSFSSPWTGSGRSNSASRSARWRATCSSRSPPAGRPRRTSGSTRRTG